MLRHVIMTRKMGVIDIYTDDIVYCTVVMRGSRHKAADPLLRVKVELGVFSMALTMFIIYLYGIKSVVLYKPISSDGGLILLSSCHLSCFL